jgi:hypothetical protein
MRNRIPRELDRLAPGVADLTGFIVEEAVPAVRSHEQKKAIMTDVVQVRQTRAFTPSPLLARRRDAVVQQIALEALPGDWLLTSFPLPGGEENFFCPLISY